MKQSSLVEGKSEQSIVRIFFIVMMNVDFMYVMGMEVLLTVK
ncbi:hypothetical protein [Priestia megaterium]|nr:hypothetical protein [Priestia megaterium]